MFKKIAMFAVTAAAGIMLLTGCSEKTPEKNQEQQTQKLNPGTPVQVVEEVNTVSIIENYDALKDYLVDDIVWKDAQGKQHDKDALELMSKVTQFSKKDNPTFLEFAKLVQNKDLQKAMGGNDSDTEVFREMIANWDNIPAETKAQLNNGAKQLAKVIREGFEKEKKSFKVIKEEVDGDTATVTAERTNFKLNKKTGKFEEKGKIEVVFTLKKIDNTWKISKVMESKK